MRKRVYLVLLIPVALIGVLIHGQQSAPLVGAGWVAKRICSGVFVSGRAPDAIADADLPLPFELEMDLKVDREAERIVVGLPTFEATSTAQFRPGLGCTLVADEAAADALLRQLDPDSLPVIPPAAPLPTRPTPAALATVVDGAFADNTDKEGTRAVVVVQGGEVLAERYAPGFAASTPLAGWSMAKSVTGALIGMLVEDGRIDLDAPVGLPEWSTPGDPRARLTWDQLLRMSSGLAFEESYFNPAGDAIQMLFGRHRESAGRFAAAQSLSYDPGTHWSYSSGTTNLLHYALLTRVFDGDLVAYLSFPRERLFGPLGMASAVMEPDASGAFVGSSFMFATARDWARFGLLFLDGGRWDGQQILAPDWIRYSVTPTPTNPDRSYGAHFWLNAATAPDERRLPAVSPDAYQATGFEGQVITVVPSQDLVIVRLGLNRLTRFDFRRFIGEVTTAVAGLARR